MKIIEGVRVFFSFFFFPSIHYTSILGAETGYLDAIMTKLEAIPPEVIPLYGDQVRTTMMPRSASEYWWSCL